MPHLRRVDKGAFLPLRESVTSPLRAITIWLNFTPKITKIQPLPGRCREITGGLKTAPRPHAFKQKIHFPPNQNSWIGPCLRSYCV